MTEKRIYLSEAAEIARAAALIRAGELVAFPTETVYGLGANALDAAAIEKIYIAKGRPPSSPLIVHVSSIEMAHSLVRKWPESAEKLARKFWPGPLTLVLPKQPHVPDRLTAGLDTVGVRMPANPIAEALIREAGVPIAAPSANLFTELSPTTAQHVRDGMGQRIAMVLDGGRTTVGIESTVLSLAGPDAVLLRPGMVTRAEIEAVIGPVQVLATTPLEAHPSPGLHARHYSPKTPLILIEPGKPPSSGRGICLQMPADPRAYATVLYEKLHEADAGGWDWIAIEQPPRSEEWSAIRDRLESGSQVTSELVREIENTAADSPALWWLGHCGFAVKYQGIVFYVDPCLSTPEGRTRTFTAPLVARQVTNADMILCTHAHVSHMDPGSLPEMLKASPRAKVVLPKSTAEYASSIGIPLDRMTTTDSDLRVEYFKNGPYARVYSVPSAHPELNWTPLGGYPQLGYLIRFGSWTIYHAGDCQWYEGIVGRLRPYNVTAALLPIEGAGNFDIAQAAQLAEDIRARWLIPMHYGTFADQSADASRFVDHMLGFHPSVGFKVFEPGERWMIP